MNSTSTSTSSHRPHQSSQLRSDNTRIYAAVDMKSYYASVECVYRDLDPLKANLLVADEERSDATICLAVSPSLKAKGVPGRPRLFEAKQAIKLWESANRQKVSYLIAPPRMAEYERISALIYSVFLKYVAPEDVHVYSVDESFIDCTPYLHYYKTQAARQSMEPAHLMAITMIRDVLKTTGITATVGIGTNLYLAKVAMDIVAKKMPADKDGVRIAELNEESYCYRLWDHRPLTDFWQIGPGKARRLEKAGLFTMGDVASRSQWDEEWFYKTFGIDGEILIDHAWGKEPVTMSDIKSYRSDGHSLSNGQVLPRPYKYEEARNVFLEMVDVLVADMFKKQVLASTFSWWVCYDYKSLEEHPYYSGPVCIDFYGRMQPASSGGTVKLRERTNSVKLISQALVSAFDAKTNHQLLYRRLGICANNITADDGVIQLDLFTDYDALERERKIQAAMLEVRAKYGSNALFTGKNMVEGATMLERNMQIGGHRA